MFRFGVSVAVRELWQARDSMGRLVWEMCRDFNAGDIIEPDRCSDPDKVRLLQEKGNQLKAIAEELSLLTR
jgi:hypothetical protein